MTAVVLRGDARSLPLPDDSVDLIVTSPPYFGLRSYTDGGEHYQGQIGSEPTPAEFIAALLDCTREWVRVLKPSGSLFVNLGDKYAGGGQGGHGGGRLNGRVGQGALATGYAHPKRTGIADKSLMGLPWRYALAATDQLGLILRAEIVWNKPNGLPESVTDRVRRSHEQVFHFTRLPRYFAAVDEIREPQKYPGDTGRTLTSRRVGAMDTGRGDDRTDELGYFGKGPQNRALNPLGKLPGSVWTIPSSPLKVPDHLGIDHFAAFPPALVRPIILGWSPAGICTVCGEGRRPVVHKDHYATRPSGVQWINRRHLPRDPERHLGATSVNARTEATITGYTCACDSDGYRTAAGLPLPPTRAAVVLDPFGGTGTTALVADAYGRTGITVDMSADYCRLAAWRTQDPGERCRVIGAPKPPPVITGQASMFDQPAPLPATGTSSD